MVTTPPPNTRHKPKTRHHWPTAILLLALLISFGGFAQYTHNRQYHDHTAVAAHSSQNDRHDDPRPTPQSPSSDPQDCPLCFALNSNVVTAPDLSISVIFGPQIIAHRIGFPADPKIETSPLHIHAGRGPPPGIL